MTNVLAKKWIEPLAGREWGEWLKPSALAAMLGQDCIVSLSLAGGTSTEVFQGEVLARQSPASEAQRVKVLEVPSFTAGTIALGAFRLSLAELPVAAGTEYSVTLLSGSGENFLLYTSYLPL